MLISEKTAVLALDLPTESRPRRSLSAWILLAIVVGTLAAGTSLGPIKDHDIFLHVAVGDQILAHGRTPLPDPWAFSRGRSSWSSSSWAADVGLALIHRWAGDRGVVLLELVGTIMLLGGLYVLLRRHRPGTRAVVFGLACVSIWPFFEERPQLASMIFVIWLSWLCQRLRSGMGEFNRPAVLALTWLWAWVHGMWILVPVMLLLVVVARRLDGDRLRSPRQRKILATVALAPVMAMLTPVGPRLILAPVRVSAAAGGRLAEWLPAKLTLPLSWGFLALFVVTVVCWAVGPRRPAAAELLWVLALGAYAAMAWRNLGPACILIAPVTAAALDSVWINQGKLRVPARAATTLAAGAALALLAADVHLPTAPAWGPSRIVATLRAQHGQVRVLNDYDVGGYLATSAGPRVRVAVDGRADRYGGAFLDRYFAMEDGRPGWRATVNDLHPDVAVLAGESPLIDLLTDSGWRRVMRDRAFVLLSAPGFDLQRP